MSESVTFDLLPADPQRGLDEADIAAAEDTRHGGSYAYGMHTPAGAARLEALVDAVTLVLAAGLGRDVALLTLLGGCLRLQRDGHGEHSDTVVRESLYLAFEDACSAAGVAPFTDDEINEATLMLALKGLEGQTAGFLKGLAASSPTAS